MKYDVDLARDVLHARVGSFADDAGQFNDGDARLDCEFLLSIILVIDFVLSSLWEYLPSVSLNSSHETKRHSQRALMKWGVRK